MIKRIPIKTLESRLNIKIKHNIKVLGIDTAPRRTGWCLLTVGDKVIEIDYGFIEVKSKNRYVTYNELINIFNQLY